MVAAFTGLGRELLGSRWSLLLIFTITALFAHLDEGMPIGQLIGWFVVCGLGLVPLARMVAEMVEALAEKLGDRIGGLHGQDLGRGGWRVQIRAGRAWAEHPGPQVVL